MNTSSFYTHSFSAKSYACALATITVQYLETQQKHSILTLSQIIKISKKMMFARKFLFVRFVFD